MSENLALVQSILADWETGDFRSVDWADPQIEYAIADEPGAHVTFGLAAMRCRWRDFLSAWEDYRIEVPEYLELDGERVLVAHAARGRGRTSGLEIGATARRRGTANLFHLRGGRVTRLVSYFDRDRALADAGIAVADWPAAHAA
jgi:ketosteroid isomerase-like protein